MALPIDYTKEEKSFSDDDFPSQYTMAHLKEDPSKVKIRVLTDFIVGKEVFGEKDGKDYPYRFKVGEKVPVNCIGFSRFNPAEPNRIKSFIAAIVWNYTTKQVEIFNATNPDIKNTIFDLEHSEEWGDSTGYDMTITRTGKKTETRYSVLPSPTKDMEDVDISGVHLDALYTGENPFKNYKRPIPVVSDPADDFEAFTRRAT